MIVACAHDGTPYDAAKTSLDGFELNEKRDIKVVSSIDPKTGEETDNVETVLNYVGFVSNKNDDILAVFPKHYNVVDKEADSRIVFNCISRHMQKRPDLYIGEKSEETYESNFPFSAFFGVYDYYQTYGLYFEDVSFVKPYVGGRVNWKETISKGIKFFFGGDLVVFPLYYRKNYHFSNFITDCMVYVIDYTISKFGILLDMQGTGLEFPEVDFLEEREYVISILCQLRQQVFKDNVLSLIENLIVFFSEINKGGNYYLKHYAFSSIWEDMVMDYLCKYYKEVDSRGYLVFDKSFPSCLQFKKRSFHPNSANHDQYISPDHYYSNTDDTQLIFDAKYYSEIRGMNYKQIAYMFMLRGMLDQSTGRKKYKNTYTALILPYETRLSKDHFKLDPKFGGTPDMVIVEEYLDIRDVIIEYCSGSL